MGNFFIHNSTLKKKESIESLSILDFEPLQEIELIPVYKKQIKIYNQPETYIEYKKRIRNIYLTEYNKTLYSFNFFK
jgi:hypothetical protein